MNDGTTRSARRATPSGWLPRIILALMVSGLLVVVGATPASALVRNCAAPAYSGCTTEVHSYLESRSQKSGAAAQYICTYLVTGGNYAGNCLYGTTFIRVCNYPQEFRYGLHYGSSKDWTVDGRDATASDATVC